MLGNNKVADPLVYQPMAVHVKNAKSAWYKGGPIDTPVRLQYLTLHLIELRNALSNILGE